MPTSRPTCGWPTGGVGIEPFKLKPIFLEKIWGGHNLKSFFNCPFDEKQKLGEAWVYSQLKHQTSAIDGGEHSGKFLNEIPSEKHEDIFGKDQSEFPLLIKWIETTDKLSVQVHPSKESIKAHNLKGNEKDECWFIVDTKPESFIYYGIKEGVKPIEFFESIKTNEVEKHLNKMLVKPGDIVHIKPGLVHAIGPGITLIEVQQPSDTTYRIYDYDRPGLDGNPRDLHLEEAHKAINFDQSTNQISNVSELKKNGKIKNLISTEHYNIDLAEIKDPFLLNKKGIPLILIPLNAETSLDTRENLIQLKTYETIFIPANLSKFTLSSENNSQILFISSQFHPESNS